MFNVNINDEKPTPLRSQQTILDTQFITPQTLKWLMALYSPIS